MAGYLAGSDSWFNNPVSQVSSQYGVGLNGEKHQYVALWDTAYANGIREAGTIWPGPSNIPVNPLTVSIETEDNLNNAEPVTPRQYKSTKELCQVSMQYYDSIEYLVSHRAISPRSRARCPGARWEELFYNLANELGLEPVF